MEILAIDVTAIIISAIGAFVSLGTVALTLLVKNKIEKVHKQMDGMKDELVASVKSKAEADTKLQVIAVINPDLKELAELKPELEKVIKKEEKNGVVEVKIVDQTKPVEVKHEKDKP